MTDQHISRELVQQSLEGLRDAPIYLSPMTHGLIPILEALLAQDDALKQLGTDYHDGWHLDGCPHVDVVGEPECSVQCKQARAAMLRREEAQ